MADPLPMLTLYGRADCCLCEGLEERLRALVPAPALTVVDVDGDPALQARYGLEVPLLAVAAGEPAAAALLPRVPPRLGGEALERWLRRALAAVAERPEADPG